MLPAGFHAPAAFVAALAPESPRLTFPALGATPLDDVGVAPPDAEFLALRGNAAHIDSLPAFPALWMVWAAGLTDALVQALARMPRLRALWLYQVGRVDLSPLRAVAGLEHLTVAWAPHLTDLAWLGGLPGLRALYLDDVPRLNLDTLPVLSRLEAIHIGGGMDTPVRIASLAPLTRTPAVRAVSLASVRVADGRLAPLAELGRLRYLSAPNVFAPEESARLAVARPDVAGAVLSPIFAEPAHDADGRPVLPCGRCGRASLMVTGRPALVLCPGCDADRVARRVARWEAARAGAAAGVA